MQISADLSYNKFLQNPHRLFQIFGIKNLKVGFWKSIILVSELDVEEENIEEEKGKHTQSLIITDIDVEIKSNSDNKSLYKSDAK